jgi:glycolate oxidase FAD binding subunit
LTAAPEILKPVDAAEVARAITWAGETRRRVEVRGGGSKAQVGRPVSPDLVLDMRGLSGIVDYAPAELVLTALAGTPLSEIETALAGAGQMLAFEPIDYAPLLGGRAGAATLGGVIAANASGPRRLKDGAARDHFLGFSAVSGRGEAFKAGGKVVKNVTGYDLSKLVAGSWGTLCVLTEVTLKVLPRPQTAVTVALAGLSDDEAARAMSLAVGSPADVSGAAHLPAGIAASAPLDGALRGGPVTLLRLEGFGPSVEARTAFLRETLAAFGKATILDDEATAALWSHVRDVRAFAGDHRPVWRISAPPMAGPGVLAAIQRETAGEGFYDWAGGLVWVAVPRSADAAADSVRRAAAAHGGHATLIRAPAETREAVPVFEPEPPALAALSARVKAGFDPLNILNPGRMRPEAG